MRPTKQIFSTQDVNLDDILDSPISPNQTQNFQEEGNNTEGVNENQIAVNVYEDERNFYVYFLIFGFNPDQVILELTQENLKVEYNVAVPEISAEILAQEIEWGKFARSIIFPSEINVEESFAEMTKDGVLKITLPKFTKLEKKTLKINVL